jgi:hypothetical protein
MVSLISVGRIICAGAKLPEHSPYANLIPMSQLKREGLSGRELCVSLAKIMRIVLALLKHSVAKYPPHPQGALVHVTQSMAHP